MNLSVLNLLMLLLVSCPCLVCCRLSVYVFVTSTTRLKS
ncbi:unnamed protein product [Brassica oleracea var. botrytis]|uniref:(rape) hypothetical protein n=1 Tax=Brassica napus TaxID=3708 RepID=A0A816K7H1_BRANA|nr:unnamed protein product [Brassica napus]